MYFFYSTSSEVGVDGTKRQSMISFMNYLISIGFGPTEFSDLSKAIFIIF